MAAYTEKIAPTGFHILKKSEVMNMIAALDGELDSLTGGYTCGGELKDVELLHWNDPNEGATNESGFNAVGAGIRDGTTGVFSGLKIINKIWCIDDTNDNTPISLEVNNTEDILYFNFDTPQSSGLSVRLVMDEPENYTIGDTMTDLNGNIYPLVKIGDVVIMARNLITTVYNDNSPIHIVTLNEDWIDFGNESTGAMCYYDNDQNNIFETITTQVADSVRLSEGFYPIGLKEYGGILYIVSAKYPDIIPILFEDEEIYSKGDVVYKEVAGINYYYESLKDENSVSLPLETTENWLMIGVEKDFINKYGFIEFGSYPSPQVLDASINDTSIDYEIINIESTNPITFRESLYNPKIINNSLFRAGTYIKFFKSSSGILETTNVSYKAFLYNSINNSYEEYESLSKKNIYKVKLYQQLTNGFIDLTDDVWAKFAEYVALTYGEDLNTLSTIRYWFNDENFKYYCPHNFKGKLAISIELEEYEKFTLESYNVESSGSSYVTTFNLNYIVNNGWEDINDEAVAIAYTTNGIEPNFNAITTFNKIVYRPVSPCGISIPDTESGKILKYKIRPWFLSLGSNKQYEDFPQEFLDKHTLAGNILISTNLESLMIKIDDTSYISDPLGTSARIATRLTLVDEDGNFLDNELNISLTPFQFYLTGTTAPANSLGTYTLTADLKAAISTMDVINVITPTFYEEYIISLVENTVIYEPYSSFSTVQLTVNINKFFGRIPPIEVTQSGIAVNVDSGMDTQFKYKVISGVPFTVKANYGYGVDTNALYNYTNTITSDTSINFGLITKIKIGAQERFHLTDNFYEFDMDADIFGEEITTDKFICTQVNPAYSTTVIDVPLKAPKSQTLFTYAYISDFPEYELIFNNSSSTVYDNLVGVDIAEEGTNHIFLKTNSGLTE